MARIRYIGSKARVTSRILDIIGLPTSERSRFVDLFSGTGAVSREAAVRGWRVCANDYLRSSAVMTEAQLLSNHDVPFLEFDGYQVALEALNAARPVEGFIFREYSPSGKSNSGHERRYFTLENAARIDGMRRQIEEWHQQGLIASPEKSLLLADLLSGVNAVANIAGTYGCFLRHWTTAALMTCPQFLVQAL